jgi:hypothetical protein
MSDNNNSSSGGVSTLGLLFVLFVGLKLTNVISWSWWWIFAPIWGPFALALVVILMYVTYLMIKGSK